MRRLISRARSLGGRAGSASRTSATHVVAERQQHLPGTTPHEIQPRAQLYDEYGRARILLPEYDQAISAAWHHQVSVLIKLIGDLAHMITCHDGHLFNRRRTEV